MIGVRRYSPPTPWGGYLEPGLYIGGFAPLYSYGPGHYGHYIWALYYHLWRASVVFAGTYHSGTLFPDT